MREDDPVHLLEPLETTRVEPTVRCPLQMCHDGFWLHDDAIPGGTRREAEVGVLVVGRYVTLVEPSEALEQ